MSEQQPAADSAESATGTEGEGEAEVDSPAVPAVSPTQAELALGVAPTGHEAVDAAVSELQRLPELAVADHPEVFDRIQSQLHSALTELDDEP